MKIFKTEQEKFWAGKFGDEYTSRNIGKELFANNTALFAKILQRTAKINSVIEFGANIGLNLKAIKQLLPEATFAAVEINQKAIEELKQLSDIKIYDQSIIDLIVDKQYDFVLSKGVLIHINPELLSQVYATLYAASNRYICLAEYYNPTPTEILYRGHMGKLFKRDFAGELLKEFSNLRLLDYGFVYHRDPKFPQDDLTWFLLEKMEKL